MFVMVFDKELDNHLNKLGWELIKTNMSSTNDINTYLIEDESVLNNFDIYKYKVIQTITI